MWLQPGPLGQGYQGKQMQQLPAYQQPYSYAQQPPSRGVPWGWVAFGAVMALIISKAGLACAQSSSIQKALQGLVCTVDCKCRLTSDQMLPAFCLDQVAPCLNLHKS